MNALKSPKKRVTNLLLGHVCLLKNCTDLVRSVKSMETFSVQKANEGFCDIAGNL